jgi:hypothetical protein
MSRDDLAKELLALGARAEGHGHLAASVVLVALSALIHINAEMGLALVARQMMVGLRDTLLGAGVTVTPEVKAEHDAIVRETAPSNDWTAWEVPEGD